LPTSIRAKMPVVNIHQMKSAAFRESFGIRTPLQVRDSSNSRIRSAGSIRALSLAISQSCASVSLEGTRECFTRKSRLSYFWLPTGCEKSRMTPPQDNPPAFSDAVQQITDMITISSRNNRAFRQCWSGGSITANG